MLEALKIPLFSKVDLILYFGVIVEQYKLDALKDVTSTLPI